MTGLVIVRRGLTAAVLGVASGAQRPQATSGIEAASASLISIPQNFFLRPAARPLPVRLGADRGGEWRTTEGGRSSSKKGVADRDQGRVPALWLPQKNDPSPPGDERIDADEVGTQLPIWRNRLLWYRRTTVRHKLRQQGMLHGVHMGHSVRAKAEPSEKKWPPGTSKKPG